MKRGVGGRQQVVFPGRGRRAVTGHQVHEIVNPELAQVVEDDRTQPGNDADEHKVDASTCRRAEMFDAGSGR